MKFYTTKIKFTSELRNRLVAKTKMIFKVCIGLKINHKEKNDEKYLTKH